MEGINMHRLSRVILLGSGILVLSLTAHDSDSSYNGGRNSGQGGYYSNSNTGSLIGRVLTDLAVAVRNARMDRHERKHFDDAAERLQEFEHRWAQGKFDRGRLDKAIQSIEHLVDADQVRGRDRAMLARDLQDLRQFRASGGGYDRYDRNRRNDRNWR